MRKPFFKAVVAGMASVAMIAGMSACGRSANNADSDSDAVKTIDSSKATGDLTIWAMGNEGDLLGDFVKGFEKENPDVKVKVTAIPWSSAHDKLQTAIAAGNGPDLAQMGTTWMADFSNSFSTVPDNLDMSDFSDGSRATGQVDGKQLGVPWYIDTRVLYYRTDIAGMAGWNKAPKTWNELKQMAKDMQKVDGVKYGMNLNPSGTDAFLGTLPFSYSAGASLTNKEQTKWTFEDTGIKKGLNFTTSLYKDGVANVNADVSSGADIANFVSGDTPMMLQGPTAVSQINELGGDGFEPFALGFSYRCYSAVFPVFPMVPAWFAYHSNSLQITAITGRVWAKCGHGWARLTRSLVVRGIGAPIVPRPGSPRHRRAGGGSPRSCRAKRVPASLSHHAPAAIRRRR